MAREITANTRAIPHVDEREVKIISLKRIVFLRFIRHRLAVFGTVVVLGMLSFAFLGPFVTPYQTDQVNLRERCAKPSVIMVQGAAGQPNLYNVDVFNRGAEDERPTKFGHPMGTDDLGRDTMTRAMFGGRVSLGIGFIVAICATVMSATIGSISGYLGGWWD